MQRKWLEISHFRDSLFYEFFSTVISGLMKH